MVDKVKQHEARQRFQERMKAEGRKRVEMWIKAEHVAEFQEAARMGHGLARLRKEALAAVTAEVRKECAVTLREKIRWAMQRQLRAESRTWPEGSNAMPPRVRFQVRPPAEIRRMARRRGWRWERVSGTWWLPTDPKTWAGSEDVLAAAAGAGIAVDRLGPQAFGDEED